MRRTLFALSLAGVAWFFATSASIDGQEPRPADGKSPDAKPAAKETKPADSKPADSKPADTKPKPAEGEGPDSIKIPNVKPREKLVAKPPAAKPPVKKPAEEPMITPEREAAAMAFATRHHGELATLLTALATRNPAQYQNAIRDLYRASERLAQVQERDAERYELDLAEWKINSRIQMLVAKLSMAPSQAVQDELRLVLGEHTDVRIKLLKLERDRAAARQAKAQELLEAAEAGREDEIERRYDMLVKGSKVKQKAAAERAAEKQKGKPAEPAKAKEKAAE
jgi:hypothetical protein